MFRIEEDVYFVTGAERSVLYDSRNGFIYHLDREATRSLTALLSDEITAKGVEDSDSLARCLVDKNLLIADENWWDGDIHKLEVKPKISFAWIEITTSCNLKCVHCYEGECLENATEMPIELFKKIVDELCDFGVRKIQLIGGEPLMAHLLKEYIAYTCGKFEFLEIYTNGTLVNQWWVEYFRKHDIHVALSVYSYEEKWHEKVTGEKGSWRKTNAAIQMLRDAGVQYRVRNVLIKDVPLGCRNTNLYVLNENKDVVRMVGRANVNLLSVENIKKRLITKRCFAAPVPKMRVSRMLGGHNCFASHLYFDVQGNVYPCVMERRISHGNMTEGRLEQLIKTEILNFDKDHITECRDCELRYFCFDCRPDAMGAAINAKPWYCTYHPLTGEWEDVDIFISNLKKRYGLSSESKC